MTTNLDAFLSKAPKEDLNEYSFEVLLIDDQSFVTEKVRHDLLIDPRIKFNFCANTREAIA